MSLPLQVVRLILLLAENLTDGLVDLMQFIRISIAPAALTIKTAKAATPYPSLWRALWNDIFSKVRSRGEWAVEYNYGWSTSEGWGIFAKYQLYCKMSL